MLVLLVILFTVKLYARSNIFKVISCLQLLQKVYTNLSQVKTSYKFFCTNPSKVKLEFLRNSSTIFSNSHRRCSIQKTVLKNFTIFTGKQL